MTAKSIATFDFSTLYTKLSNDKLVDELSSVIGFAFDGGNVIHPAYEYQQVEKHFREGKTREKMVLVRQFYKQLLLYL